MKAPFDDGAETTRPRVDPDADSQTLPGREPGSTGGEVSPVAPLRPAVEVLPQLPGYRVEAVLGRGAMGVVLRATDLALQRPVALKMILAGSHASGEERARFQIEAQAVARVTHPNIVQIFEVGEHEGRPYLALELAGEGTLAARLHEKGLAPREAAELVEILARAIHAAHEKGVVHRDLKPANVLVAAGGVLKVSDFGLAKDGGRTRTGVIMGTPNYMSPEQAAGHGEAIGPATDIYSLGAILYEMLVGQVPHRAPTPMETLHLVKTREPIRPSQRRPGIPRDLETICLKSLEKDPLRRYATARDLADELHRFLAGEPILARPVGRLERGARWARRNPVVAGLSAALVLSVVIGTTFGTLQLMRARDEAIRARNEALDKARIEKEGRGQVEAQRLLAVAGERRARERLAVARALAGQQHARAGDATAASLFFADAHEADPSPRHGANAQQMLRRSARLVGAVAPTIPVRLAARSGDRVAIAAADGRILVEDLAGVGAVLRSARRISNPAPSGEATGSRMASVALSERVTGVDHLVLSPDGSRLVTAGNGDTVLWDAASGQRVADLFMSRPFKVAFTPDSRHFLLFEEPLEARYGDGYHPPSVTVRRASDGEVEGESFTVRSKAVSVFFSSDGRWMSQLNSSGFVELWDLSSRQPVGDQVIDDTQEVRALTFSADDRNLLGVGGDGAVRRWDVTTGLLQGEPVHVGGNLNHLLLFPDGLRAVAGSRDGTLGILDLVPGLPSTTTLPSARESEPGGRGSSPGASIVTRVTFQAHASEVTHLAISPDGSWIASAGMDRFVRVWDPATGLAQGTALRMEGPVGLLEFDGRGRLVTAAVGGTARVWEIPRTGAPWEFRSDAMPRTALDGKRLIVAPEREVVELIDTATGRPVGSRLVHGAPVTEITVSPDGTRVATAGEDGTAVVWSAVDGTKLVRLEHPATVQVVSFSPDGRWIATGCGKEARVWDARSGVLRSGPLMHQDEIDALDILGRGRYLHVHTVEPRITHTIPAGHRTLWDLDGQQVVRSRRESSDVDRTWEFSEHHLLSIEEKSIERILLDGKASVSRLALPGVVDELEIRPDGESFAVAIQGGPLQVRSAETMAVIGRDLDHTSPVSFLWPLGSTRFLVEYDDRSARLIDATRGEPVGALIPADAEITTRERSPSGRWLATRYPGGRVRLWDTITGQLTGKEILHGTDAVQLSFSLDDRWIATLGDDHTVRLWECATGEPLEGALIHGEAYGTPTILAGGTRLLASIPGGCVMWNVDWMAGSEPDPGVAAPTSSAHARSWTGHRLGATDEVEMAPVSGK